jgi:hypothetical protein
LNCPFPLKDILILNHIFLTETASSASIDIALPEGG